MQIENIDINKVIEYEKNPRRNDHVISKMATAIKTFGFKIPILLKKNNEIIDGHLRFKAAKMLALKTVPAIYIEDLNENEIKALRISINKLSEVADWDLDLLKLEFENLKNFNFDLTLTGFENFEIEKLNQNFDVAKGSLDDQSDFLTDNNNQSDENKEKCPKCGYVFV